MAASPLDAINRRTWARAGTVREYERLHGWTDPGERAAFDFVAPRVRGGPILDIGAGAGRTTPLLMAISEDYVAVDYTPQMCEAFRKLHPGVPIQQMDARELRGFGEGCFALAVFSFNGIDSVDLAGRGRVLAEVHRVLRPGGFFVFSAHNHDGPGRGEHPGFALPFTWNPLRLAWRAGRLLARLPAARRNHRRLSAFNETHESWSVMNAGAHRFGIVVVYTTLAEQLRQLREAGFDCEAVFENTRGDRVREGDDTRAAWWLHYVARRD